MPNQGIRRLEFKVWSLPRWAHYSIAVCSALTMMVAHQAAVPLDRQLSAYALFGYAVGISAFCGGFGPGIVAALVSILLGGLMASSAESSADHSLALLKPNTIVTALMWVFISALCHLLRETALRYRQAAIERDLNRDRLNQVVDSLSDPFYVLDTNLNLIYANKTFLEGTQTTLDEIFGKNLAELFPPVIEMGLYQGFREALDTGQSFSRDIESPVAPTWYHVRAYPDQKGITVYLQDATLRKNLEQRNISLLEEERTARAKSETAGRLKDEFIATLSHELRTPLTSILGWAELLDNRTDDPKIREGLRAIQRSTRTQANLIEELLDMNRIASGNIALELEYAPLDELVIDAIEVVRNGLEAKNLKLTIDKPEEPLVVRVDPARLHQVIVNLLDNAIKFTPPGGLITVTCFADKSETGESVAKLVVQDSGEGIDAGFIPYLFDRFRQANSSTSRHHGGLGLGLSIVKQLLDLHGGEIFAESEGPNLGSTFTVKLPLVPFELPAYAAESTPPQQPTDEDLKGLRVLVVEDDDPSREIIQLILSSAGAETRAVSSASAAYSAIPEFKPDILIGDIGMPEIDGMEMMRTIRQNPDASICRVPAIALTAFAGEQDQARARQAGFDAHVSKPIDQTLLKIQIRELVDSGIGMQMRSSTSNN